MTVEAEDTLLGFETESFDPFKVRTNLSQGARIRAGDVELWCHDSGGDGEAILLMGGFTAGHFVFDFARQFLKDYRIIAWEPRGLGLSDKPDPAQNAYSAEVWAEDAINLLNALGIKKTHVWAEGFGGYIGIRLAAQRPDLVATLITSHEVWAGYEQRAEDWKTYLSMVEAFGTPDGGPKNLAQWMDSGALPWFVDWETRNIEETVNAEMVRSTVGYGLLDADVREELTSISAPTRVILGGVSVAGQPEHIALQTMRKNIGTFDVVTIPQADEAYGTVTHPKEFAAAAREIFEAHPIAMDDR